MFFSTFMTAALLGLAPPADEEHDHDPYLNAPVYSPEVWIARVVRADWQETKDIRFKGTLTVVLTGVVRGRDQKLGTTHKIDTWQLRGQGSKFRDVGISPWPDLPLQKDSRLVFFLGKEPRKAANLPLPIRIGDGWKSALGGMPITDVLSFSDSLVGDLKSIDRCLEAKKLQPAIMEVLAKPKEWGETFRAFAVDVLFDPEIPTGKDVRLQVFKLCTGKTIPPEQRLELIDHIATSRYRPGSPEEIQAKADMLVRNLLDSEIKSRRGLLGSMGWLLRNPKTAGHVKFVPADLEPLMKVVEGEWMKPADDHVKKSAKRLLEALKKRAKER